MNKTSPHAEAISNALYRTTVAFLTAHLGHRITVVGGAGRRCHFTLDEIRADQNYAVEAVDKPYWIKDPDYRQPSRRYSIRTEFADAAEVTCQDCRTSRNWSHAHAEALAELRRLALPFLDGATGQPSTLSSIDPEATAVRMARLIDVMTRGGARP